MTFSVGQARIRTLMRVHLVTAATLALVLLSSHARVSAAALPGECLHTGEVQFAAPFARLHAELGDVMGVPTACSQRTGDGDLLQATSTGLAIYRVQTETALFSAGDRHWALGDGALVTWIAAGTTVSTHRSR